MKIAVSYLKSKYTKEETIQKINETSADYLHVDLMDGNFVATDNINWDELPKILKISEKPLDVHLMVKNLEKNLLKAIRLNPEIITIHLEATTEVIKWIKILKEAKIKVGIALNPDTSINDLIPYLKDIDLVLVMSVMPGLGGQKFMQSVLPKLEELITYQKKYPFLISIDGGINAETVKCVNDKVDMVVSGSFICLSDDYEEQIKKLR